MFGSKALSCLSGNTNFTQEENSIAKGVLEYVAIPYGVIFLFILTSNLMLIYGFHKTSRPFTIVTKLFIYLSLIDIINNIFLLCSVIFKHQFPMLRRYHCIGHDAVFLFLGDMYIWDHLLSSLLVN